MLRVVNLSRVPQYFDEVFAAVYNEWGKNNPNYWKNWIKSSDSIRGIPSTYVVLDEQSFVGTFSFWHSDLQSRQDITAWLGGIVVAHGYRGKGIGLFIQQQAKMLLQEFGIKEAYLFTEFTGFYEKTGWEYQCDEYDEEDNIVRLYRLKL